MTARHPLEKCILIVVDFLPIMSQCCRNITFGTDSNVAVGAIWNQDSRFNVTSAGYCGGFFFGYGCPQKLILWWIWIIYATNTVFFASLLDSFRKSYGRSSVRFFV